MEKNQHLLGTRRNLFPEQINQQKLSTPNIIIIMLGLTFALFWFLILMLKLLIADLIESVRDIHGEITSLFGYDPMIFPDHEHEA